MLNRRFVFAVLAMMICSVFGLALYFSGDETGTMAVDAPIPTRVPLHTSTPTAIPQTPVPTIDPIVIDARVVPAQSMNVRFAVSGIVDEILVDEGEVVEAGQLLARLDQTDLEIRLTEAQLALDKAILDIEQAQLLGISAAADYAEQVQRAEADITRAQNQYLTVEGSVTEKDIVAAEAALEQARAVLARLEDGPDELDLQVAREELRLAETNLASQRTTLSAAKIDAEGAVATAANEVRNAQDNYSRIYWENRNNPALTQADADAETAAFRAIEDAERTLQQAQRAYDLAVDMERTGIATAESNLRSAQLNLEALYAPARPEELAAGRAQVANAENQLDNLVGERRALELEAAALEVDLAQMNLALLDPTSHQLNTEIAGQNAEFARRRAELQLQQAELNLQRTTLLAPMAGTVVYVNVHSGDPAGGEETAFGLADLSTWELAGSGLSELDVTRVEVGNEAIITFDALPGFELPGTVTRIGTFGTVGADESVTYDVIITPNEWNEKIRWNMTASVTILPDEDL